jgi:hypothetical protein
MYLIMFESPNIVFGTVNYSIHLIFTARQYVQFTHAQLR